MLIACPKCSTSYQVDASSLAPAGRSVRCVRCQHVWFATSTVPMAEIARAHRADIAAFSASMTASAQAMEQPEPPPAASAGDNVATWTASPMASTDAVPALEGGASAVPDTGAEAAVAAPPTADPPAEEVAQAAEPTVVADAPALAPTDQPHPARQADTPPVGEDIETVAARRAKHEARRRRWRWPLPGLATAILALIALNTALVAWRADIVRLLPQTAAFYAAIRLPVNLRGLVFTDVTTIKETQDGVQVLLVEGTIASTGKRAVEVPRLRFAVRNDAGQEIYAWTALPNRKVLTPGETLAFRSRLASPPREGSQVLVRFFNRRDLVAGNP
jgi:predicted Zn finger-like uncharacterized protein